MASGGFKVPTGAGTTGKRVSIRDKLVQMRALPDEERNAIFDSVKKDSDRFRGFRHHAKSTQNRQDYHLEMYDQFLLFRANKERTDFTDEEMDDFRFPHNDHDRLWANLREFVIWIYQLVEPRSLATGSRIKYSTLAVYRDSIVYWCRRSFNLRNLTPPNQSVTYFKMTEAMRAVMEYSDPNAKATVKSHLGLAELRELLDNEMVSNRSIENSEQHQCIWCFVRHTSCRPGSIGVSGKYGRSKPLPWRAITFQQGPEPGRFCAIIEFDNINIKRWNDPNSTESEIVALKCQVPAPDPENIIFSVPHRLLVIALRRGLLDGIETLDELLDYKGQFIQIKAEHLDDPIFYRSAPRGEIVDFTMTTRAMTQYLSARGKQIGYTENISMYSIRRRAATDMVARVGLDETRRMMGHAPNSFTLERYYLSMGEIFDATAVALDQEIDPAGRSRTLAESFAQLALGRLNDQQAQLTRGPALRAMTDKLIASDANQPDLSDPIVRRRYRARQRGYAQQALFEQQATIAKKELSSEEWKKRKAALGASEFAEAVNKRALELSRAAAGPVQYEGAVEEDDDDAGMLLTAEPEGDLEDLVGDRENDGVVEGVIDGESNEVAVGDGAEVAIAYKLIAESFMTTMLDNSLNQDHTWSESIKICPECQLDDTAKNYNSAYALREHLNGTFHTPFSMWTRAAENRKAMDPKGRYVCQYCLGSRPEGSDITSYAGMNKLRAHIRSSDAINESLEHDQLKAADGWYDDDFRPTEVSAATGLKKKQHGERNLRTLGLDVVTPRQIINAEPLAGHPGLVRGSSSYDIPTKHAGSVIYGTAGATHQAIPTRFGSGLVFSAPSAIKSASEIPADFRSGLVLASGPHNLISTTRPSPVKASGVPSVAGLRKVIAQEIERRASRGETLFEMPSQDGVEGGEDNAIVVGDESDEESELEDDGDPMELD
ncbi:unnamed protein product [Zymoseptoria tritici ST99CH_1A5]|uniref:Uncharacterized protein n=1 Tax=Zymoseptoria tritici ST99CH_1A5 TaxID=1276529 RepID=A0A1Y6LRD2_ZYMTR|nr:unnamed protein product [Zymoseptoria tritici ST99CH_1A5]